MHFCDDSGLIVGLVMYTQDIMARDALFKKRVQQYERDMEPHMAVLGRMKLEYPRGLLWTAIHASATSTSSVSHELKQQRQQTHRTSGPVISRQHVPATLGIATPSTAATFTRSASFTGPG